MAEPKRPCARTGQSRLRCAVYTRKSSEKGLEQSFNSPDAQHEACAAYVASQRHEGWQLLSTLCDDGGFSGGGMERPALKRLLADVDAGRIALSPRACSTKSLGFQRAMPLGGFLGLSAEDLPGLRPGPAKGLDLSKPGSLEPGA